MLIEQTLDKLNAMKIGAMADACRQQMQTDEAAALGFEVADRVCAISSTSVDAEPTTRRDSACKLLAAVKALRCAPAPEGLDGGSAHARPEPLARRRLNPGPYSRCPD